MNRASNTRTLPRIIPSIYLLAFSFVVNCFDLLYRGLKEDDPSFHSFRSDFTGFIQAALPGLMATIDKAKDRAIR